MCVGEQLRVEGNVSQVKELSVRFQEQLQIETEERDLLFRQMDNIDAAGKIAERQLEETKAELQNLEKKLEDDERHNEVKVMVRAKQHAVSGVSLQAGTTNCNS